jgi:two-component system, OmpR family, response regulator
MQSHNNEIASHPWTRRSFDLGGLRLRVLVVDDNHNAAEAMAAYLSFEDMTCRVAFGGREAVRIGTGWVPDVILMDISMPECNGYEATRALRENRRTSGIVILAFTALNNDAEVRKHIDDRSFDGYCQKGQSPEKLLGLVMSFVL